MLAILSIAPCHRRCRSLLLEHDDPLVADFARGGLDLEHIPPQHIQNVHVSDDGDT